MENLEMIDPLEFERNIQLNQENKEAIPRIKVNEPRTQELEKELQDLKKSYSCLMQTTSQKAANYEELRIANEKEIKLLIETIQNLRQELEVAKSENSEVQYHINMECNKCQHKENDLSSKENTVEVGNQSLEVEEADEAEMDKEGETNKKSETENKKKYIVVNYNYNFHSLFAVENVEFVDFDDWNDLRFLRKDSSCYHKEMFVIANNSFLNPTSGWPTEYSDLLSICKHWKELCPEGEIHAIGWYEKCHAICDLPTEIRSIFTSYNTLIRINDQYKDFPKAIAKHWPKYSDLLLREDLMRKYIQ